MRIALASYGRDLLQVFRSRTNGEPDSVRRARLSLRIYGDFIANHPDMPSSHRERFLAQIQRCQVEARGATA